ncbi:uncharacterized protein EDB91DRAFT_1080844 [Suillus paluster]|uniref:uncharacterized protein n=1 Tax=Suillus paluster TaxID=48578 RepID=UPI001B87A2A4|nr:uncharacterized protein EDB91DRAFT_1080844 [Suillus paluster]KAG1744026.1 hypothetical protein EDB91DRAFT_1080844 [Suillus paluster]
MAQFLLSFSLAIVAVPTIPVTDAHFYVRMDVIVNAILGASSLRSHSPETIRETTKASDVKRPKLPQMPIPPTFHQRLLHLPTAAKIQHPSWSLKITCVALLNSIGMPK